MLPGEPFKISFGLQITPEETMRRDTYGFTFDVLGEIHFIDAMERRQDQKFMGIVLCSKGGVTTFTPQVVRITESSGNDS